MNTTNRFTVCLLVLGSLVGCATLSPQAASLNQQVSLGIQRYHERVVMPLIEDWKDGEEERYNLLLPDFIVEVKGEYKKAAAERASTKPEDYTLTPEEDLIFSQILLAYDRTVRDQIQDGVQELTNQSQIAVATLISLNDDLTEHLSSAASIQEQAKHVTEQIGSIAGIDLHDMIDGLSKDIAEFIDSFPDQLNT